MLELGESAEDAARREVLEETGLTIGALKLLGVYSGKDDLRVAENGDEWHTVMPGCGTNAYAGTLRMGDGESISLAWRDIGGLPEYPPNPSRADRGLSKDENGFTPASVAGLPAPTDRDGCRHLHIDPLFRQTVALQHGPKGIK
jgi:ADP-ribose pyrophosphatase YjhB (NUDIX family)